jgi:hypothetical protein
VFTLTHGFHEWTYGMAVGNREWPRRFGPSVLLNPKRYGAMTLSDYARFRLSVFTREEAGAIVTYLNFAAARDDLGTRRPGIESAVKLFWLERVRAAPDASELDAHVREEDAFHASLLEKRPNSS